MTFTKKSKIILGAVAAVILVIGGGVFYMQHQEHEKMVAIATSSEAKKVYEEGLNYEAPEALKKGIITSMRVDEDSLSYHPMGGLQVNVIFNNNKDYTIGYNLIDNGDGTYYSTYFTYSPEFVDFLGGKK